MDIVNSEKVIKIENLGENIKNYRNSKGLSLKELSKDIEISPSMLSQIESGKANPSLNTLKLISKYLEIPMFSLFMEKNINSAMVVRKENRIRITSGSSDSDEYQLSYDLLSPDMKGDLQLCEMKLSGFQYNSDDFNMHKGEEVAVCSLGAIELLLEDSSIILNTGDSVRIPSQTKHMWRNPNKDDCAIIFAISPPTF